MQKIEPLNEKEQALVKAQLESASKFVEGFSPADSGRPITLAALDRAFAAWVSSKPDMDLDLVNAIINYVGVAFGQALVDGIGLKWVVATDDHGSDFAVYGLPEYGDIVVYPANFVAKRWKRHEINFLEEAYRQIANQVRTVFRQWQRSQSS